MHPDVSEVHNVALQAERMQSCVLQQHGPGKRKLCIADTCQNVRHSLGDVTWLQNVLAPFCEIADAAHGVACGNLQRSAFNAKAFSGIQRLVDAMHVFVPDSGASIARTLADPVAKALAISLGMSLCVNHAHDNGLKAEIASQLDSLQSALSANDASEVAGRLSTISVWQVGDWVERSACKLKQDMVRCLSRFACLACCFGSCKAAATADG